MAKQNFGGVYANMDFPPYVWQEYPKHIPTGPYGKFEVAYSKADEDKIVARLDNEFDNAPAEAVKFVPDPEKDILIARARELRIPINAKWSKAKLSQLVSEAEEAVDSLPAELPNPRERPSNKLTLANSTPQPISMISAEDPNDEKFESADDLKNSLYLKAKEIGVTGTGMHLWGIPRLKQAIAEHEAKK